MSATTIRPARPEDVPAVVAMVHELAEYERAPEDCHLTTDQLSAALFGDRPALYGHVAVDAAGEPVAMMLWFLNFSTWAGVHGIYLEDLYVRPDARAGGIGRALLSTLAQICVERGYARLEWWVLHWNPAREFYHAIGAAPMEEWLPYRLTGAPLARLAAATTGLGPGGAPDAPSRAGRDAPDDAVEAAHPTVATQAAPHDVATTP